MILVLYSMVLTKPTEKHFFHFRTEQGKIRLPCFFLQLFHEVKHAERLSFVLKLTSLVRRSSFLPSALNVLNLIAQVSCDIY